MRQISSIPSQSLVLMFFGRLGFSATYFSIADENCITLRTHRKGESGAI